MTEGTKCQPTGAAGTGLSPPPVLADRGAQVTSFLNTGIRGSRLFYHSRYIQLAKKKNNVTVNQLNKTRGFYYQRRAPTPILIERSKKVSLITPTNMKEVMTEIEMCLR